VKTPSGLLRDATDEDVRELRQIAVTEHPQLGLEEPSETTIRMRIQSLARERGLRLPGSTGPQSRNGRRPKTSPGYLQAGLEPVAQKCAKHRRAAKDKRHVRIVRENTDRFYLMSFLKGGFARAMTDSRAFEVFAAVVEQLSGDVETWVSVETLAKRLGRTRKTVGKSLRRLEKKHIVSLVDAATREYSLNGKPIRKSQGYVIEMHAPMFWDWDSIGGVPEWMKKYLADYEDEPVDK
jgi:hypothetical protein